jgi:hypothetical protein
MPISRTCFLLLLFVVAQVALGQQDEVVRIKEKKQRHGDLQTALKDFYPRQAFPLDLALIYLDTPASGTVLTSSVQASVNFLSYGDQDSDPAQVSIVGVVLNDQGKSAASFKTGLKVNRSTASDNQQSVIYNNRSPLKPGIYQVRVAARDDRSGVVGNAMEWIVIPELSTRHPGARECDEQGCTARRNPVER